MPKRKPTRGPFVRIPQYARDAKTDRLKRERNKIKKEIERNRELYPSDYESEDEKEEAKKARRMEQEENDSSAAKRRRTSEGEAAGTKDASNTSGKATALLKDLLAMGKVRKARFERLKKEGDFFLQSEESVDRLLKVKGGVVEHTVANCFDEMQLRKEFPDQGVGHKYFASGKFAIQYVLSREGIPVCQVIKKERV
ncbi:unnamed protein product [Amoebophrya sp. A25]|nr:unnamed protein product [Amoebophrya sp. A25]|eukprot:GSA25T00022026001.1